MKSTLRWLTLTVLLLQFVNSASAIYDPRLGRFLSRDPIREEGGINLYAYCGNDPVNRHDPLGLDWRDGPLDGQWVPLGNPTYDQASSTWNVMMRYVIPMTWGGRLNVYRDSMMPLAQAKRLAPHPSYWQMPLVKPAPTLLAGTDFQGVDWAYLGYYMDNHPGFNAQLGILEGGVYGVGGGYVFGGVRALLGARLTGYLGSGLLGMSLGEWAKNDFAVNPRVAGQVVGGIPTGGLFVSTGEAHGAAGMRFLAEAFAPQKFGLDGGMMRSPRLSQAGSVINPFAELLGEPRPAFKPEVGSGNAYSVAYQMKLAVPIVPRGTRYAHFADANESLFGAMDANLEFGAGMRQMIPDIEAIRGTGVAPEGWVWNHLASEPGVMQLVPAVQHWSPNPLWTLFHPLIDGKHVGGFKLWGHLY
jgi:hypothetical protein